LIPDLYKELVFLNFYFSKFFREGKEKSRNIDQEVWERPGDRDTR
jgi:hypothetical protein